MSDPHPDLPAAVVLLRFLADWGNDTLDCEGEITTEVRDRFFRLLEAITGTVERAAGVERSFAAGRFFIGQAATE